MENKPETYTYTFSADQQTEIKKIRSKYLPLEEDKMDHLRKLDKNTAIPGTIAALIIAVIGLILHGTGAAMIKAETLFFPGTVLAFSGLLFLLSVYPIYHYVTKKQRKKAAPDRTVKINGCDLMAITTFSFPVLQAAAPECRISHLQSGLPITHRQFPRLTGKLSQAGAEKIPAC